MVGSFHSETEAMVSESVRSELPEGLLDSVKDDPSALLDPNTARSLRDTLADTGSEGASVADNLLDSLNLALAQALGDVFTALWIAVALSFAVAVFLRVRYGDDHRH